MKFVFPRETASDGLLMADGAAATSRTRLATIACLGMLLPGTTALAQNEAQARPEVSIELRPSRSRLEAGGGLGVIGTVRNESDGPIYIREHDMAISLPIELEGGRGTSFGYYAFFPTEDHTPTSGTDEEYYRHELMISPGGSYGVVWSPGPIPDGNNILSTLWAQRQFMFFSPGEYQITLSAKLWPDSTFSEHTYHTLTTSTSVTVSAPETTIVFAAGLGGLIGYIVVPGKRASVRRRKARENPPSAAPDMPSRAWRVAATWFAELVAVSGAVLLAAVATILVARLADTQFVIQVTIRDFWGAIAIGFMAFYGGTAALDRIAVAQGDGTQGG
jgi:hypothetical protein